MTEKIVGAQYRVVAPDEDNYWEVGTVATLVEDDGSDLGYFKDLSGSEAYMYWTEVELITEDAVEPVEQPLHELVTEYNGRTHRTAWYTDKIVSSISATDEPDHSQTVAQSLNTLIQQYGMATVTSGIEQWLKFHSEEQ